MSTVRLALHLASVWSWLTAVIGLVWLRSHLTDDVSTSLRQLLDRLALLAVLGAVGLFVTGMWSAAAVGPALESDRYGAVLVVKTAAFIVSGWALVTLHRADPSAWRPLIGRLIGAVGVVAAVTAAFLGVVLRS